MSDRSVGVVLRIAAAPRGCFWGYGSKAVQQASQTRWELLEDVCPGTTHDGQESEKAVTSSADVAYTFAYYRSTCLICGQSIRKGDGIGLRQEVDQKNRWSHSACRWAADRDVQVAASRAAREGYALRTGRRRPTDGVPATPRRVERYSMGKPPKSPAQAEARPASQIRVSGDIATANTIVCFGVLPSRLGELAAVSGIPARELMPKLKDLKVLAQIHEPSVVAGKGDSRSVLKRWAAARPGSPRSDVAVVTTAPTADDAAEQGALLVVAHVQLTMTDYAMREHRIMGLLAQVSESGFRVDEERLRDRLQQEPSPTLRAISDKLRAGRVHPRFDTFNATGRAFTSAPNLAGLPKNERDVLLPDDPGQVILVADLCQIEPRIVAALAEDRGQLAAFEAQRDIYAELAHRLLGDASQRDRAKAIVNGLNYGMGGKKIADAQEGLSVSEAKDFTRALAWEYPEWANWRSKMATIGRTKASWDNGHGRQVPMEASSAWTSSAARVAQSAARDVFVNGLLRLDDRGLTPSIRMLLHDEVVLSVPIAEYRQYEQAVLGCLTSAWKPTTGSLTVPITAKSGRPGRTWADAYPGEVA
jgi:hypothetical protein